MVLMRRINKEWRREHFHSKNKRGRKSALDGLCHNDLFDIGGQISLNEDGANIITSESITSLDNYIDQYNSSLDPLKEFILPGGDLFSANLHVARSVTRRAERAVVELYSDSLENNNVVMYLNRLSDYFFVLSRFYNKSENISENTWKR